MAPSATFQARIKQFEALDNKQHSSSKFSHFDRAAYPPRRSAQPQTRQPADASTSSPPDIIGEPVSPTASQFSIIQAASVPYVPRKPRIKSPSPSPPNLGCNSSLIDLQDWVVEGDKTSKGTKSEPSSLRPIVTAPPLPPRSSSKNTSKGLSVSSKPSSPSLTPPNGLSLGSPNSLTVEHTYPPLARSPSQANVRQGQGHVHASSTSSFHSVSLSSDGGTDGSASVSKFVATYPIDKMDVERESERDRESVDDAFSFETVSSTGVSSPSQSSTHEWEKDFAAQSYKPEPPKHPFRKPSQILNSSVSTPKPAPPPPPSRATPTGSPQPSIHRVPPPPVHRDRSNGASPPNRVSTMSTATSASDRSSIFSTTTVTTAHTSTSNFPQLLRPTPVPEHVRKRYERIFAVNETAQNRIIKRKLAVGSKEMQNSRKGWRGLSVDLITALDDAVNNEIDREIEAPNTGPGKLDGRIVLRIWSRSQLAKEKLRDIWSDCALPSQNYLDRDGFVKGMWRIDEELRRAQLGKKPAPPVPSRTARRITVDSVYS